MPFLLIIVGVTLLVAGVKNTTARLFSLISGDFGGTQGGTSFLSWALAIAIVGGLGYLEDLRPLSRIFMALIVVVLFLKNGGFFQNFFGEVLGSAGASSALTGTPLLQHTTPVDIGSPMIVN
jgi:hypothetical protein